jgi:acyl-CoA synthetase (AMP-forming)/AMP-acid ligase II
MHSHYTTLYPLIADALEPPTFVQLLKIIRRYGFGYFKKMIQASRNPIKTLMSMPPYTGAGVIGIVSTFLTGRILVHVDRFRPSEYLRVIEKEQVNVIALPPALATILVRHPDIHQYDMSSLIYIALGTAPTPPALVDALIQKFNRPVMIGYGATELVGGVAMTRPFADSPRALRESVGKVVKGWEAKVVNKERQEVPTGEIGELAVRGGMKMLGYYKAEQLTQEVFDQDGWYYTGDLATIDEQGYVRIVGRLKDMIIRAGQNIYPAEVESVLMTHPGIKNAAVIGVPDALSGEKVLAYVIPERNDSLTALEVLNFCRDHMAPYKVPSNVYFVDEFPLNATGKVLKRILREEAVSRN